MTATDADLQALVSQLQEQLREMTRERDAWRSWADTMPTHERIKCSTNVAKWMFRRPGDDSQGPIATPLQGGTTHAYNEDV